MPLTSIAIGVPIGAALGPMSFDRHVEVECGLRQQAAALLHDDVVLKAEILRRDEARRDAAGLVALHRRDPIGDRREFAAEIFGNRDLPAPLHGAPDQLEFLPGGKALAGDRERRADRAVLGRDLQPADIAAGRLGERHFRPELGRTRRRESRLSAGNRQGERASECANERDRAPVFAANAHGGLLKAAS